MAELGGEAPPVDEQDRELRRDGWRNFLTGVQEALQDPVRGQVIMQLGAGLSRDLGQGQSASDFVGRAIQDANAAGGRAEEGLQEQENIRQVQQRKDQELDLQRQGVEQRGEIAANREAGEERRLDKQLGADEARNQVVDAQRERQFLATQRKLDRNLAESEQRLKVQLARMDLSDAQRQRAHEESMTLARTREAIAKAKEGGMSDKDIIENAMEMSTETNLDGEEIINRVKFQNNVQFLRELIGQEGVGGVADEAVAVSVAQALRSTGEQNNLSLEEQIAAVERLPQYSPETRARIIELLQAQGGGEVAGVEGQPFAQQSIEERAQAPARSREKITAQLEADRQTQAEQAEVERGSRDVSRQIAAFRRQLDRGTQKFGKVELNQESLITIIERMEALKANGNPDQAQSLQELIDDAEARLREG